MIKKLYQFSFIVPFIVFCIFLGHFAVNVPQGDDFELVLHFLTKYQHEGSLFKKLSLMGAQFVEHRLLYTRLIVLIQYWLSGGVSFYLIIFMGNLSLVGIFIVAQRQLYFLKHSACYLLPVSLLLFQPCYSYDGVLWPAATLAYNSVSFFAILTIHWITSQRFLHFCLAFISAFFCTYTFGNGILILGIAAVLLAFQKRWKELLVWAVFTIVVVAVYFYEYETIATRNKPFYNLTHYFDYSCVNLMVFMGGALNWSELWPKDLSVSDYPSIIMGALVLTVFIYLAVTVLKNTLIKTTSAGTTDASSLRFQYFLLGSLSFFVLTGLLLCLSRVDKDMILMHINRYRVHSVVAVLLTYLYFVPFLRKKRLYICLFLGGTLGFWLLSYFHFYAVFSEYQRTYKAAQHNWAMNEEWFIYRDTSYWEEASKLAMHKAKTTLNYHLKVSPFSEVSETNEVIPNVKIVISNKTDEIHIAGFDNSIHLQKPENNVYIAFKHTGLSKTYLLPAAYSRRSLRLVLLGNAYYYPEFNCKITYRNFPKARYQIGIAYQKENNLEIKWQPTYFENNHGNLLN
ncbi:MAG: hypothetical protein ACK4S0_00020 [Sediminibacterium sp.]